MDMLAQNKCVTPNLWAVREDLQMIRLCDNLRLSYYGQSGLPTWEDFPREDFLGTNVMNTNYHDFHEPYLLNLVDATVVWFSVVKLENWSRRNAN